MSDEELIARLHLPWPKDGNVDEVTLPIWVLALLAEAADRIEELKAELKTTIKPQVAENMVRLAEPMLSDALAAADKRIEELEAKLKSALAALGDIGNGEPEWPDDPQKELDWCRNRANEALAKIKREQP